MLIFGCVDIAPANMFTITQKAARHPLFVYAKTQKEVETAPQRSNEGENDDSDYFPRIRQSSCAYIDGCCHYTQHKAHVERAIGTAENSGVHG